MSQSCRTSSIPSVPPGVPQGCLPALQPLAGVTAAAVPASGVPACSLSLEPARRPRLTPLCSCPDRVLPPDRYQLQAQEETKERRHSHTIGGLPESDDQSELPSPSALSMSLSAKGQLTNVGQCRSHTPRRGGRGRGTRGHLRAFLSYVLRTVLGHLTGLRFIYPK